MGKRVLAGLIVGACWLAVLLFAPGWLLFLLLLAMTCRCQYEFYGMLRYGAPRAVCSPAWGVAMGSVWLLFCFLFPYGHPVSAYGDAVLGALLFVFLFRTMFLPKTARSLQYAAVTLLGFFYLPFMLVFFIRLAQWGATGIGELSPNRTGIYLALYLAILVKFNDVGGRAFGIPFGRHKLLPEISPKKSWEGFFGGLLFCLAFGIGLVALARACPSLPLDPLRKLTYTQAASLAGALAVIGLLGDLVESHFKRLSEVKDSAPLLPGMGGILDMFDSLVFAPAFFYFCLKWIL